MAGFLAALQAEIRAVGALLRETGIQVESIYFGGGTPTTVQGAALADAARLSQRRVENRTHGGIYGRSGETRNAFPGYAAVVEGCRRKPHFD